MKTSIRRPILAATVLGAILLVALAFAPAPAGGTGCGHDARLDLAFDSLEKAFALVTASENEGVVPPFGGHDIAALGAIRVARGKVMEAIAFAENSCH